MDVLVEAFRQVNDAEDFHDPKSLLEGVTAEQACAHEGNRYSIATYVAHADYWQKLWLGLVFRPVREELDWPNPTPEEWPAIRDSFVANWALAIERAKAATDDKGRQTYLRIVLHNVYHIGQIFVLLTP